MYIIAESSLMVLSPAILTSPGLRAHLKPQQLLSSIQAKSCYMYGEVLPVMHGYYITHSPIVISSSNPKTFLTAMTITITSGIPQHTIRYTNNVKGLP